MLEIRLIGTNKCKCIWLVQVTSDVKDFNYFVRKLKWQWEGRIARIIINIINSRYTSA